MKLIKILEGIDYTLVKGSIEIDITDISYDSRSVSTGYGFVALEGIDVDGHDYVDRAISNGCKCVFICRDVLIDADVTVIKLKDTRRELANLSANLFDNPAKDLIKIGITGTKGKTTVSWMIKSILENAGYSVGVIGTMGTFIAGKLYEHKNTTPESYQVQKYLRMMVDAGIKYLVMEVSSQALKVGRVSNIEYDYAIFTNLSIDHIGAREHSDFEDYANSKAMLFKQSKVGIINVDDIGYERMVRDSSCDIYTFGKNGVDLQLISADYCNTEDFLGVEMNVSGRVNDKFMVSAPGMFSVYNAMGVVLLCNLLGIGNDVIKKSLRNFKVNGRCEVFNLDKGVKVVIDYAHNKISMESIIQTMKEYKSGRVVAIFGCGGGRSFERRYELGEMAGKYADFSIITTDNPRNDDIREINKDIESGIKNVGGKYIIVEDRKEAICYAISNALENDIILLLGKGHEKYQEIKGVRYLFDEKEIIEDFIKV